MLETPKYKFTDLTRSIIGCAMKVHQYFGSGFPEVVYQRSLMIELAKAGIDVRPEVEETVFYYNDVVGKRRIDLIVDNKVLVEVKAITELDKEAYNQVLNCLNVFKYEVGLLLNFGKGSLEFRRFALDRK